jgi:hypothetical protein
MENFLENKGKNNEEVDEEDEGTYSQDYENLGSEQEGEGGVLEVEEENEDSEQKVEDNEAENEEN